MRLGRRNYSFELGVLARTNPMAGLDEGNERGHGGAKCYTLSSS
jgi:hypothetical protein